MARLNTSMQFEKFKVRKAGPAFQIETSGIRRPRQFPGRSSTWHITIRNGHIMAGSPLAAPHLFRGDRGWSTPSWETGEWPRCARSRILGDLKSRRDLIRES